MFKTVQMDAWVDSTLLFDTHMVICACHCLNSYFFSPYLLSNRCLSRGLSPPLFPKGLDFSPRSSALFCPQCPSKLLLFRGLYQSSLCCYALNTCSSSEADSNQRIPLISTLSLNPGSSESCHPSLQSVS